MNRNELVHLIEDKVRQQLSEEVNLVNKVTNDYKKSTNYITVKKKVWQLFYDFAKFSKEYNLDHKQMSEAFSNILINAVKK